MVAAGAVTVAAGAVTGEAAKVTEAAARCDSVRGATEVAVVDGAWAECSGRSGAGGTAAVVAATGAAVKAATGAAVKITAAVAVCGGSVRGATEVAVVDGAWAECSGRSGAGGTAAAVAATGAAVKVTAAAKVAAAAVCGGSVRGATKIAVVGGARAESCCHSGAGGAMETVGGAEVRGDFGDGDSMGSPLMPATRAACSRLRAAISSSTVLCWAVTS